MMQLIGYLKKADRRELWRDPCGSAAYPLRLFNGGDVGFS
jgi:hypothetical protein